MISDSVAIVNVEAPLRVLPVRREMRAGYLRGFGDLVRKLGGDPKRILEDYGIDPVAFEDPQVNIEGTSAVNMLDHCSSVLNDSLFGFRLADYQVPAAVLGSAMALAQAAPTFRQGLQSLVDYVPAINAPEGELEIVVAQETAELRWHTRTVKAGEQVNHHAVLLYTKALRMLERTQFRPRYATLTIPIRRADLDPLQRRLGCKIYGKSGANAIAFPAGILDRPLETSDTILFALVKNYLAQLGAASRSGFAEQVEDYVRRELPLGLCSLDRCARKLGTSSRTLQKRLMHAGATFTGITQRERIKLAKQSLIMTEASLDQIAFRLGYADQTSFGRAFKRSEGITPRAFRSRQKSKRSRARPSDRPL